MDRIPKEEEQKHQPLKTINRQFERCKAELIKANCPQIFIDCFSKYTHFSKLDIYKWIKDNGYEEKNYNR